MKRKIILMAFLTFVILSVPVRSSEKGFDEGYSDAVVDVRGLKGDSWKVGSGFIHRSGYIFTADHIVTSENRVLEPVEVRVNEGNEWRLAEVVDRDPGRDIALLRSDVSSDAETLHMSGSVEEGKRVLVPGSDEKETGTGTISNVNRSIITEKGMTMDDTVEVNTSIYPGDSGSPVITSDGKAIGVITARKGEAAGFAVPAYEAEELISQ